jgi:hypothetical protein
MPKFRIVSTAVITVTKRSPFSAELAEAEHDVGLGLPDTYRGPIYTLTVPILVM